MIQKKFLCRDVSETKEAVSRIGELISATPHKAALVTFYEKGFSIEQVRSLVGMLKDCGGDDLLIAGISATLVAELMPEGTGILLNLILTENADIEVFSAACSPGDERVAAGKLRRRLDGIENVRAVELFVSNMSLNTTRIMEESMEGHEDAVLFGTSTIRNLPTKLSFEENENALEIESNPEDFVSDEFVIGSDILRDGFTAVIFSGKDLNVQADYALGWNPVGRKLSIELSKNPSKGETVITKINGFPAVDIYKEYLGVYPDSFLIGNICEFPLVVEREGINICLIPLDCGRDGELYFMMSLKPDEKLRLTFASHDEVLRAGFRSLEKMDRFAPEAVFLVLCGNRINFLKEDAHIEWDSFAAIAPDNVLMHGACELYYHNKKGGILNSAHVAVGMREGDNVAVNPVKSHPEVEEIRHGRLLSLSDRMSVFLSKITNELLDMAQEARDANNAKSAFLSHMSHEIRTPINAILGMDEMILQDSDDEEILGYADGIRSSGSNLLSLVNDILDFSKIEAGKMGIVPVEYGFGSMINDMYNTIRLRADDKALAFITDIDPDIPSQLVGDDTRIKQIISNLLTNAVKYTEKGSVTFAVKKAGTGKKKVRLRVSVKDTGIGIRPEDRERLFDEYSRFDEKRNRTIEGTGLGLSIARELLEMMGSHLDVKSIYGEGSEFSFEIEQGIASDAVVGDINERFKKPVRKKRRNRFTAESAHILIVDDVHVNLVVATRLLRNTKIKIDTATSGEEALGLVKENKYDVILLDHVMPGMDGLQTLKKMKEMKDNKSAGTPVISMSANDFSDERKEYKRKGYSDILSKPINPEALENMLMNYIPSEKIIRTDQH
ncbi:MAG: response regulator [Lachnospiraceae bacterium]|nr:response regulator [Lachnospiraceae bacterium]